MMLAKFSVEEEESRDDDADDFPKLKVRGTTIIMPQKELVIATVTTQMAAIGFAYSKMVVKTESGLFGGITTKHFR